MADRSELHPRNKHNGRYDFPKLISASVALGKFVMPNKYGELSINFFDPQAVKALNKALLRLHYGVEYWDIPPDSLCPPIPGRADYIHYISDLVGADKKGVKCLDIGVGANCIYPIIGHVEYGWGFVGSDISKSAIQNAQKIIDSNRVLKGKIELRHQDNRHLIFKGVITPDDFFDVVICNPPFHDSSESAKKGATRKLNALKGGKVNKPTLNFGGVSNELWCEGGELQFLSNMIKESKRYSSQCHWFTSLVSKEDNLKHLYKELTKFEVAEHRVIDMQQGNKISRILAWHY